MGKKSPSPPATPDPAAVAATQGAANLDTAIAQGILNRTNQITPTGTSTYKQIGTQDVAGKQVPQFEQTVTLSPDQQAILDKQSALSKSLLEVGQGELGQVQSNLSQPIDLSNLPPAFDTANDPYKRVADSIYNQYTSRLDPQWQQDQQRLETQLTNQGFTRGSDAWNKAVDAFSRQKNDAYQTALNASVTGAGTEESRQAALSTGQRNAALSELLLKRNQPLNEIAALMGTSPGVTMPSFAPIPQTGIAGTDIVGPTYASYQGNLNAFNNAQGNQQAAMGGLFGLGGTLGGAALQSPWLGKMFV